MADKALPNIPNTPIEITTMLTEKEAIQPAGRVVLLWSLAMLSWGMAFVYSGPENWVRRTPLSANPSSVVAFIDSLGPVWSTAFYASAVALTVSLIFRRSITVALLMGLSVWTGYGTGLWLGGVFSTPPGPFVSAILASAFAVVHFAMFLILSRVDDRERHPTE